MKFILQFWGEVDSSLGPIDIPDNLLDMPITYDKSFRYNHPDLHCFIHERIPLFHNGDLGDRDYYSVRVSDGRLLEEHRCSRYLTFWDANHPRINGEYPVLVFSDCKFTSAYNH